MSGYPSPLVIGTRIINGKKILVLGIQTDCKPLGFAIVKSSLVLRNAG